MRLQFKICNGCGKKFRCREAERCVHWKMSFCDCSKCNKNNIGTGCDDGKNHQNHPWRIA